jgi:hypothetical protein
MCKSGVEWDNYVGLHSLVNTCRVKKTVGKVTDVYLYPNFEVNVGVM